MWKSLGSNIILSFQELLSNPLRTFLSILGVSIGVFCIVSVSTVFDSMEANIKENMATLGNDVLYISKFSWLPEDGQDYAWWEYKARPVVTNEELNVIKKEANLAGYAAISYTYNAPFKFRDNKIENVSVYAVSQDFNKLQAVDLSKGRYFSMGEMQSGQSSGIILGAELAKDLFLGLNPINKEINIDGRSFIVLGVIKKTGQMTSGFQFDNGAIISYNYYTSYERISNNTNAGFADPMLMIKARTSTKFTEMKYQIEGILRRLRGLKVTEGNNFAFNQLAGVQDKVEEIFTQIKFIGWIIGGFSLIVGIFSVANIMFVSVKERTNIIGIKKAIGAKNSAVLSEFLIEAIVLCLLGGFLGMLLTFLLTKVLSSTFEFPIYFNIPNLIYGVLLSIVVGVIAGYIPAKRASRLDPVVAIRS